MSEIKQESMSPYKKSNLKLNPKFRLTENSLKTPSENFKAQTRKFSTNKLNEVDGEQINDDKQELIFSQSPLQCPQARLSIRISENIEIKFFQPDKVEEAQESKEEVSLTPEMLFLRQQFQQFKATQNLKGIKHQNSLTTPVPKNKDKTSCSCLIF